jgi:hypothetical protein
LADPVAACGQIVEESTDKDDGVQAGGFSQWWLMFM